MNILQQRLRTKRRLHQGEEVLLALAIAAGELGNLVNEILRAFDLTHPRYSVLRILRGAGEAGASCGEIGERMLISPPDVTRLVDPLVGRGWVERTRSADDRRVVVLRLTPQGHQAVVDVREPLERLYESIAGGLGAEDCAELVRGCETVIDLVQSEVIR